MRIFYIGLYSACGAQYTAPMRKQSVVHKVHHWIGEVLQSADMAIDATVGNGHDTLFLAQCVGERGHVYGFDIQASALESAKTRLLEAQAATQVTLLQQGHENMCRRWGRAASRPSCSI
jgi:ubiquinone/menaquinone biosynthesis C-methylase UbiE